jgi:hypothetical protein
VGRIYQQTFIDTYSKMSFAKLYDRKTPVTAVDLLNDRVLPFFEEHDMVLSRMLTDRGTEFCGTECHEYELYLAVEDIDHRRTKAKSPQTNGICERFHQPILNEFYRATFRKKIYGALDELQVDLDAWVKLYNENRPIREGGAMRKLRSKHSSIHPIGQRKDDRGVSGGTNNGLQRRLIRRLSDPVDDTGLVNYNLPRSLSTAALKRGFFLYTERIAFSLCGSIFAPCSILLATRVSTAIRIAKLLSMMPLIALLAGPSATGLSPCDWVITIPLFSFRANTF